jgi:hypothetical protein
MRSAALRWMLPLFGVACMAVKPALTEDTTPPLQTGTHMIAGTFDVFTTDELGNVYTLRGDEMELWDKQGRSWLRNSLKTFGRIRAIDAFYSLKPMVFSAEQGMLAVLDNTLSVQGSVINLSRRFPQVVLAAMSVQNNFWLFDERELSLLRVDGQLRPLADTGRLDQLLGITPRPVAMQENDSWLYVNDPVNGILVFDLFGTYARTIPIHGATSFEVRGQEIYFFKEGGLHRYDMRSFAITPVLLPTLEGDVLEARVERGMVYLRQQDRIVIAPVQRQP